MPLLPLATYVARLRHADAATLPLVTLMPDAVTFS